MNNIGFGSNPLFALLLLGGIPHEYLVILLVLEPIIKAIYSKISKRLNFFDRYVRLEIQQGYSVYSNIVTYLQKNNMLKYPLIEYTGSLTSTLEGCNIKDHPEITCNFDNNHIIIIFVNKTVSTNSTNGNTSQQEKQIIILKAKNDIIIEKFIKHCSNFCKTLKKCRVLVSKGDKPICEYDMQINKTFDNIYIHPDIRNNLVNDLQTFIKNKKYYKERGIPYKRGYMFYGVPGCGKSSTVYAISKLMHRSLHFIKINGSNDLLSTIRRIPKNSIVVIEEIDRLNISNTKYVLKDRETLNRQYGGYNIDINIIVDILEGLDSVGDLDSDDLTIIGEVGLITDSFIRDNKTGEIEQYFDDHLDKKFHYFFEIILKHKPALIEKCNIKHIYKSDDSNNSNSSILVDLMEVFDGYHYLHGCIIIITTNHPEKINPVLIRPGRIDMRINFVEADRDLIINIFTDYYKDVSPKKIKKDLSKFSEKMIQANIINNIILPNANNYNNAIKQLFS